MYEFRDEAVTALTPRQVRQKVDSADPSLWTFANFTTSRADAVTLVTFKQAMDTNHESTVKIADELSLIARSLSIDSRVVIDFAGVQEFAPESIEALAQFQGVLQSRGSQVALCNLESDVRASFFPKR